MKEQTRNMKSKFNIEQMQIRTDNYINDFIDIDSAVINQNYKILEKIYWKHYSNTSIESYYISLAAKSRFSKLSLEESDEISNYLQKTKVWNTFELYLLINTLEQIKEDNFTNIENILLRYYHDNTNKVQDNIVLFSRIIAGLTFLFIKRNQKENSQKMLKILKEIQVQLELIIGLEQIFLEGLFLYRFEDKNLGNKLIQKALYILSTIEATSIQHYLSDLYNQIKEKCSVSYVSKEGLNPKK